MSDQITTPVGANDTGPVMVPKLLAIHDHWWGEDARDSEATIAGSVGRLSDLLSGTAFSALTCGEERTTYLPKLNALNAPTDFIVDTSFGGDEEGAFPGNPFGAFTDTGGTTPATWGNSIARVNDQSGNERNAVQSSAALRPLLGRAPVHRRNLAFTSGLGSALIFSSLTRGEDFSAPAPDGGDTVTRAFDLQGAVGERGVISFPGIGQAGDTFTASAYIRAKEAADVGEKINFQVNRLAGDSSAPAPTQVTLSMEWQRVSATITISAGATGVKAGLANAVDDDADECLIWGLQIERGSEMTAYQNAQPGGLDITEAGVSSPPFIRFDLSDDVLPTAFPDGFTGDVMVFGRKGSWIERDVEIASAASLNIGPTSFTGAPAGVLAALGDIVGWTAVDRTLTDAEVSRLLQYNKARGGRGLLVPGPELLTNNDFSDGDTGWTLGDGWSVSGGLATKNWPSGSDIFQIDALAPHRWYLAELDIAAVRTTGPVYVRPDSGSYIVVGPFMAPSIRKIVFQTGGDVSLGFRVRAGGASDVDFNSFSLRELRPQEDW